MPPLRIVLVLIEPPLPFGNAAARWFYVLLRGLVERGHRVTALAACSNADDISRAHELFPAPRYDLRLYPFPVRSGWRAKKETLIRPYSYMFGPDLIRDFGTLVAEGADVIHLEQLWAGWLGLEQLDRALVSVHYLAAIDLGEQRARTVNEAVERFLLFRTERKLAQRYRYLRTVSPRLEGPIRGWNPGAEIRTVPLGLDTSLYPFIADESRVGVPTVSLIGSMGWAPSHSAAVRLLGRLWPAIKRRVPAARLEVVGWSARERLADYIGQPDVTIAENVPETRPYFERASVLLYAPSRGSGMKVKIQEAMAFGVPVVTTSEGVEGLPAVDGVHAGICDDDPGLIERTVDLLLSSERQDRQRRAARELIETWCGPGPTLDGIEAIYAQIVGRRAGGVAP